MRLLASLRDTIARRFALTIILAIVTTLALTAVVIEFAGVWARPSAQEMGLLERADDIVRMLEAAPDAQRTGLADAVWNEAFRVDWYAAGSTVALALDAAASMGPGKVWRGVEHAGFHRRTVDTVDHGFEGLGLNTDSRTHRDSYFESVELDDHSWVVFTAFKRFWGVGGPARLGIGLLLMVLSIAGVSAIATYQLSRPIRDFTSALRRFGTDPRATPIAEAGPRELRQSIAAFNAMQAQFQRFVEDRTTMLAAISHDLRTPLTKMRLRGEFIDNDEQRMRLFRDVDDMQAMITAALAFFRDDLSDEETTGFDLPELLRTIADDYCDQGHEIAYSGALHRTMVGRPFALKRAFGNLVDNAVKYGQRPEIELRWLPRHIQVYVRDSGPGIPPDRVEQVFSPFYRLERSRNRATGGVGLGLTSAQGVVRAHGGTIMLTNRPDGGLQVQVDLPQ